MTEQRVSAAARRSPPARRRGRSWRIPLYVAVIAISAVIIWRVWPSGGEETLGPDPSAFVPSEAVTAFWVEDGFDLVANRWRPLSTRINNTMALGRDCLPSEELKAGDCSEVGDRFDAQVADLRELVAFSQGISPPPGTPAVWLEAQQTAWATLDENADRLAAIAHAGFDEAAWFQAVNQYIEDGEFFSTAELALADVLAEVERGKLVPQ